LAAFVKVLLVLLCVPLALYIGIVVKLYAAQDRILFQPARGPMNVADAGVPGLAAVTLHTADGLDLTAWYKAGAAGRPVIVYFHGNSGDLDDRAGRLRLFDSFGWGELFVEYRGYGPNPGVPSQDGFNQDALAAYGFLQSAQVPPQTIVLYGESLGTGVAVRLATERPVGAVVLDSPYVSIAAVAQARFWFLPVALLIKNPFTLRARITGIHAPLLVMQGALDHVVPPAQGVAVYEAALPPKAFWSGPGTYHYNVLESGGAAVLRDFVRKYVSAGGQG
jgi:fermentation-respiration switch protein FrsA (DUF1100 family)